MVLSGAALPVDVVRKQIESALDIMVHLSRFRDRSRRVTEITEIAGMEDGEIRLNPLYTFVEEGEDEAGMVLGRLQRTGNPLLGMQKLEQAGITLLP
ncbi:MAG: pilus assembly protein [Paenibacillus sp.]|nr:pilus assembly protein [Paenibacillus sp.]